MSSQGENGLAFSDRTKVGVLSTTVVPNLCSLAQWERRGEPGCASPGLACTHAHMCTAQLALIELHVCVHARQPTAWQVELLVSTCQPATRTAHF